MAKCELCGKKPMHGHNRSRSMTATKRKFRPNIQRVTIFPGGKPKKVYACAKCIKALGKDPR